jgi:dTDP-4-amino-4,6-dideoxygalactose transaminase
VLKFDSASSGNSKEIFRRALVAEGLPVRSVYEPIHQNSLFNINHYDTPSAWSYYRNRLPKECYPISEKASYSEGIILPHQVLLGTNKDLDDVVEIVKKVTYDIDALRELE